MNKSSKTLIEGVSESTAACLLVMVQGNILVGLTGAHLFIAAQTGIVAGAIAFLVGWLVQANRFWAMPLLLGTCTAVVDYYVHPGSFGSYATEAIVTGIVAGALSLAVTLFVRFRNQRVKASVE